MRWLTFDIQREPGFRLNLTDLLLIGFLILLSGLLRQVPIYQAVWWLPFYLGLSFFLFCNVFRIETYLERTWYVPFTLLSLYGLYTLQLEWITSGVFYLLEPLKWALILYHIKHGPYRGVAYYRLRRYSER